MGLTWSGTRSSRNGRREEGGWSARRVRWADDRAGIPHCRAYMPVRQEDGGAVLPPFHFARKSRTSLVVAAGFSSITQWPEAGTIPSVTFIAAKRISSAMALLKDFSAPTANTGIASLPPFVSSSLLSSA